MSTSRCVTFPNAPVLHHALLGMLAVVGSLVLLVAALSSAHAEQADRILAVVGDRVVTDFDIRLENALAPFLDCPEVVLCNTDLPVLDRLMDQAIIRGLAGDASAYQPSNEEVERRLTLLRGAWLPPEGYSALLEAFGLSENDLAGFLFSRMVVERYVQRNVGMLVSATGGGESDLQAYFAEWMGRQRVQERIRLVAPLD